MSTETSPQTRSNVPPEIPPEVERSMSKERAVWQEPDPEKGQRGGMIDPLQRLVDEQGVPTAKAAKATRAKIREACLKKSIPVDDDGLPIPVGLPEKKHREILAKTYECAPKMDADRGDQTYAFVAWLYLNHPKDAAVRYYGRGNYLTIV